MGKSKKKNTESAPSRCRMIDFDSINKVPFNVVVNDVDISGMVLNFKESPEVNYLRNCARNNQNPKLSFMFELVARHLENDGNWDTVGEYIARETQKNYSISLDKEQAIKVISDEFNISEGELGERLWEYKLNGYEYTWLENIVSDNDYNIPENISIDPNEPIWVIVFNKTSDEKFSFILNEIKFAIVKNQDKLWKKNLKPETKKRDHKIPSSAKLK